MSLSGIIHHSHSFTRLEIYHHIYFIYCLVPGYFSVFYLDQSVLGHVVRAKSEAFRGRSSRKRHRNKLAVRACEKAVHEISKNILKFTISSGTQKGYVTQTNTGNKTIALDKKTSRVPKI